MNNKSYFWFGIYIFFIMLALLNLTACINGKKATNYMKTHPRVGAAYCADEFPVVEKTDSTDYLASQAIIDSLLTAHDSARMLSIAERQALFARVDHLATYPMIDYDSITDGLFKIAASDKRIIDQLTKQNKELSVAIKNVKPVQVKVRDAAVEKLLQLQLADMSSANDKLSAKFDQVNTDYSELKNSLKGKVRIPLWWLIVLAVLIGGYTVLRMKKILSPIKI